MGSRETPHGFHALWEEKGHMSLRSLNAIFVPASIALIGASEEEGSTGRTVLENLLPSGPKRAIFPVNPRIETALGLPCYPSVTAIPAPVDLAVIALPPIAVPDAVEDCGRAGTKGAVILSSGFKERGEEGRLLEGRILDATKRHGIRVIGPNCIGVIRPHSGLYATYLKARPEPGNIAFISQSGALGGAILDWAINAHVGFSMFASLGPMIDTDFGDMIDFLGGDRYTRSIMLYMENVGNAKKFMSAARGFARTKPIIIVKPGRFRDMAGSGAFRGIPAGDDRVYDAAFKRAGVIRVKELAGLFNTASVLESNYLPKGRKLAVVTNAGGFGIIAMDALVESGGEPSILSPETLVDLDAVLPPSRNRGNPVDVLGDGDGERYGAVMRACLKDPEVDGLLVIWAPRAALTAETLAGVVIDIARHTRKPIITAFVGGGTVETARDMLLRNDVPTYETPEDAVRTYLYMYKYHRNLGLLYETPSALPLREAPPKNHLKVMLRRIAGESRTRLTEEESKDFLVNYGIPVTTPYPARDLGGALSFAGKTGYPLVLKVVSYEIENEGEVQGVEAGIRSPEELRYRYPELLARVRKHAPDASLLGVTVQTMVENIDYKVRLGARKHKDFGTVIFFGASGAATEFFEDMAVGLPPLNQTLARRLMEETRVYSLLAGRETRPAVDMKRLERMLVSFSNLIVDFPEIAEIDVNPIAIAGEEVCSLDARITIDRDIPDYATEYPHLVVTPYPTRYVVTYELPDGIQITLRPIRPEDEPLEREMLSTLKPETMRTRFFSIIKDISHEMLIRFCNIDYDREMAIVAEIREGEQKRIVAIGRLISDSDFRSGEYAVLVHDDFQGKGLGYKLVDVLIGVAQDKGLDEIQGTVLAENEQMLRIVRKLGFTVQRDPDEDTVTVRLSLK